MDRYGVLGVDLGLLTDSEPVRSFFAHAYRWFPAAGAGERVDLAAILDPSLTGEPFALAGDRYLSLEGSVSPENRAFLFLLEEMMDRIDGSLVLHASAVSAKGRGVMLAGPALAGKSTLVLELLSQGHSFLSDDAAPLERRTGRLLPYPRAVGIRKDPDRKPRLPGRGVHELPHRWLVDPEALGATMPAQACDPAYLFYLDPGGSYLEPVTGEDRIFEVSLAVPREDLVKSLGQLRPDSLDQVEGRPFPTVRLSFPKGSRPVGALTEFWRAHRDTVLGVEEHRPEPRRAAGPAEIVPVGVASLLLPLVRDLLNRGEGGRLMASHDGRIGSLTMELAGLLRNVNCYRVLSGDPPGIAAAIEGILGEVTS